MVMQVRFKEDLAWSMFNLHVFLYILNYSPSLGIKFHISRALWSVTCVCVSHQCLWAAFESLFLLSKPWTVSHPCLEA
jgi:hypothetical protein